MESDNNLLTGLLTGLFAGIVMGTRWAILRLRRQIVGLQSHIRRSEAELTAQSAS